MAISGSDGSIILTTQIDQTGLKRGMASMKNGVAGLSKSFAKIGAAIGVAFGVGALINFGKQAVQLASDLQEVQNVVDVAFGDMSYKAEEFAKTAIESFGISELSAKRTASTYMAMAKGMGIASDVGSDMAIQLTALSADMASFYNVSQEMADTALKSIFTGETETLKQYGIVMTEVNLEQYALSQGITKSVSAMTQQEKTMLRYQFVLEQTALAQGDFVRTQDSWANQTRILSERWKEMQVIWGDAFRTIGTLILPAVNSLIKGLAKVGEYARVAAQSIAQMFGKEIDSSAETASNISTAVDNQNDLTEAVEDTNKALKGTTASFDEVNILSSSASENTDISSSIGGVAGGAVELNETKNEVSSFSSAIQEQFAKIAKIANQVWESTPIQTYVKAAKTTLGTLWNFSTTMWGDIKNNALMTWQNIQGDLQTTGENLVELWTSYWSDFNDVVENWEQPIINSISDLFNSIWSTAIDSAVQLITKAWADFTGILLDLWNEHGADLLNNIGEYVHTIIGLLQSIYDNVLEPIITPFLETLSWLWDKHIKGLVEKVGDFIGKLVNGALEIYNKFISPILMWLLDKFSPAWAYISNLIIGVFGSVVAFISDVVGSIIGYLGGIIDFIVGVFTGNWKKAWNGVKDAFKNIINGIVGIFKFPINLIIDGINSFIAGINKIKLPNWGILGDYAGKGFNIPKIPKLAQGAVIPPNREFLAVLGDQKSGTNIEAPLDTIKQAVAEVLAQVNIGGGFNGRIEVPVIIDGREIARAVRSAESGMGRQTITGGFANVY